MFCLDGGGAEVLPSYPLFDFDNKRYCVIYLNFRNYISLHGVGSDHYLVVINKESSGRGSGRLYNSVEYYYYYQVISSSTT